MNILDEALRLTSVITRPPGDLVYFLVTLFALQQAFLPAYHARRTQPTGLPARRWLWALGFVLFSRLALILVALPGNTALFQAATILPPLERWLELTTVALIIWAALPGTRAATWQTAALLIVLVAGAGFYIYDALQWPTLQMGYYAYNGSPTERLWEGLTLALLALAFVGVFLTRPQEWEWLAGIWFFWGLGHSLQLLSPEAQVHNSGWLRLAALVVYPMLAWVTSRLWRSGEVQAQESGATPTSDALPRIFLPDAAALQDTLQTIETARQLEPSLIVASSKLADLLGVDMCALALTTDATPPLLRFLAVHPPTSRLDTLEVALDAYPVFNEVYQQARMQLVQSARLPEWLKQVYSDLGFTKSGPLLVLPLTYKETRIGLMLLGSPFSEKTWPEETPGGPALLATYRLVADLAAGAIVRARDQTQKSNLFNRIRGQDTERQRLEMELQDTRQQAETLKKRITVLVTEVKSRDQDIARLNRELESKGSGMSQTEVNFWQNEVQELVGERESLHARVQELERDRQILIEDRERIADQLSDARVELDNAEDGLVQLQGRMAELERARPAAPVEENQQTSSGLVLVGVNGQIEMADAFARRMLHLPEGDVLGMPIDGLYPDPEWAATISRLLLKPDGQRRAHFTLTEYDDVEADMTTLADRNGAVSGVVITLASPESAVERREAIVSTANEFRTPMTAITGYADLLLGEQAGILNEMQQQFLARIRANVERMGHLLNDLINLASPDSQPIELSPQPVDFIEIIQGAVRGLEATFQERRLGVRLDISADLPRVKADHDSLYQIMLRLLSNAALCSKEETEISVLARLEEPDPTAGSFVRITVADTGGGIATEDYGRVFRRFYRANQPLIQGMGEKGIGMAMVKTLVEANGGRIWVKSKSGVGSAFSFILPAYK